MRTLVFLLACTSLAAQDNQVSGIVVDHLTKQPLNHVLVELTRTGKDGGTAQALTGEDGRFSFVSVPNGKYNLMAQKRGQMPEGFQSTDGGFASAIVVDGKRKTTGLIFALRSDSSIGGVVMGDDGDPVRHAQVHLYRESVMDGEAQTFQTNGSATNSEGHFHFGHLEPGKYYLAVNGIPWYAQYGRDQKGTDVVYPVTFYGDTTDGDSARAITVTEGAASNVQIELHAVPGIHVKVPSEIQNVLLSVRGPGGSEIGVHATRLGMTNARQGYIEANGGRLIVPYPPDGAEPASSQLIGLAAGRYQVSTFSQVGDRGQVSQTVDLVDGSTLALDTEAANAEVSGRIIFDTPRPAAELELALISGGRRRASMAEVGADGTFKFDKAQAGKFDLNLTSSALVIASTEAKGARFVHGHLEIASGASVELAIHAVSPDVLAKVEGLAVKDGKAAAGAMVLLVPRDLERTREFRREQSDMDGSFTLTSLLPGRYTLLAIDDGTDLAYKDEKVIRPYLEKGISVTVPLKGAERLEVAVQARKN